MSKKIALPQDYTTVLNQVEGDGGETFNDLAETLQFDRPRLKHIITSLQHKGLLILRGSADRGFWIELSRKGRRVMAYRVPQQHYAQPGF